MNDRMRACADFLLSLDKTEKNSAAHDAAVLLGEAADEIERMRTLVAFAEERRGETMLLLKEIERLRDVLEQALDDMRDDGLAVCQATKELMQQALTGREGQK